MTAAQLDIFNGDITSLQTSVFVRTTLSADRDRRRCELRGTIEGPYSDYAQTLPAKYELRDSGTNEGLLSKASVPDPCAWTPNMPFHYRLEFELCRDGQTIDTGTREFGLRDLATNRQSILLAGKRTVIRGVGYDRADPVDLRQWRNFASAMLVTDPNATLLESASHTGVAIVAQISKTTDLEDHIRNIAAYPSTTVIWLAEGCTNRSWRYLTPNVLIARSFPFPSADNSQADVLVCEIEGRRPPQMPLHIGKPILALRPLQQTTELSTARAACDILQRDLAPQFNLAGYLV